MTSMPINVTLLGGSNSGKTSYLVGLYGVMRRGTNGLTFAATELDEEQRLSNLWLYMSTQTGYQRWPVPTDSSHDYEFELSYGFKPICRYILNDNRGGALHGRSIECDVSTLINKLFESNCIFIFFSVGNFVARNSVTYTNSTGGISVTEEGEDDVNRLNQMMNGVARKCREKSHSLPGVVILLTKYDLIAGWPMELVLDEIRNLFSPLFSHGSGWTATICPVSLGKELAGNVYSDKVDPVNVHIPLVFAFNCSLRDGDRLRHT